MALGKLARDCATSPMLNVSFIEFAKFSSINENTFASITLDFRSSVFCCGGVDARGLQREAGHASTTIAGRRACSEFPPGNCPLSNSQDPTCRVAGAPRQYVCTYIHTCIYTHIYIYTWKHSDPQGRRIPPRSPRPCVHTKLDREAQEALKTFQVEELSPELFAPVHVVRLAPRTSEAFCKLPWGHFFFSLKVGPPPRVVVICLGAFETQPKKGDPQKIQMGPFVMG